MGMIDGLVRSKVLSRSWSFTEISNLVNTVKQLSLEIYMELKLTERFELVREVRINEKLVGSHFEDALKQMVTTALHLRVAEVFKEMLNGATINFGDKNEISEGSLGRESSNDEGTDEEKDSQK